MVPGFGFQVSGFGGFFFFFFINLKPRVEGGYTSLCALNTEVYQHTDLTRAVCEMRTPSFFCFCFFFTLVTGPRRSLSL